MLNVFDGATMIKKGLEGAKVTVTPQQSGQIPYPAFFVKWCNGHIKYDMNGTAIVGDMTDAIVMRADGQIVIVPPAELKFELSQ